VIVDAHTHMGVRHGWRHEVRTVLDHADALGVDAVICSHLASIFYSLDEGNRELGEAMRRHPDRLHGYVAVPSGRLGPAAPAAVAHYAERYGMVGVKIYSTPRVPAGADRLLSVAEPAMLPVVETATELGLPILAHATPHECAWLTARVPEARILMAHMGGTAIAHGDWTAAVDTAHDAQGIYLDTATSTVDAGMVEYAVSIVGAHRVIYGSDMPLLEPSVQLARITGADITAEERALILGGNAVRLFGLADAS
jgi:predicted TIM-barrel fold metal-dependent hydrolase